MHDDHGVRDQPMETIKGGGVEQASFRRGEDSREESGPKAGGTQEDGVADIR